MATIRVDLGTPLIMDGDSIRFSGNTETVVIHVESYKIAAKAIGWENRINMIKFLRSFSRSNENDYLSLKFCKDIVEYMYTRFR